MLNKSNALSRSRVSVRFLSMGILALGVVGCDTLSRDGPMSGSIVSGATVTEASDRNGPVLDYVLVDIDQRAMKSFGLLQRKTLYGAFGGDRRPPAEIRLGVGDLVQVTIFEAQAGGLFIPAEAGARSGNFVTIPAQQVDKNGNLTVPYAGDIRAAGRSIPDVQREIVDKLKNRAIEPQVIVTLGTQRSSQVALIGELRSPNKIDINPAGDRLLDAVAKAGGPSFPGYESIVTLQRGGRQAVAFVDDIVADPRENIYVYPGDTIYVYRQPQTFLAFGATGASGQIEFGATHLSLAEGVAKAGGLDDTRADASQVFLYRMISRAELLRAKIDITKFDPAMSRIPVIFRANFSDPTSYFAAQNFYLNDKDVIFATNSASHELYKFLTLLNNTSDTVARVPANALTAKNSIKALRN